MKKNTKQIIIIDLTDDLQDIIIDKQTNYKLIVPANYSEENQQKIS